MIYLFNEKENINISQIGGKGKALLQTYQATFPVPEFIILSVDYLDPWFETITHSNEYIETLSNTSIESCEVLKNKILSLTLTEEMKISLTNSLDLLDSDLFAVRSSSPEEDLENTSFAGMYDTLLGITHEKLEKAIVEVFASCFDYKVISYKKKNNINISKTRIAIIIQKQLNSEVSGVGFSLNPINNCYDEVVINASFGLGESVVSGIVTPDIYIYDFVHKKIIEKKINQKNIATCLKEGGGIQQEEIKNKNSETLQNQQIIHLASLIKKCEQYYKKPVDIEWAYENNKLYLLQTRPITTYLPFFEELITKPGYKKRFYMDLMIMTQGFDKPMSVLGLDTWSKLISRIKGGMMTPYIHGTAPALHGRQYISFTDCQKIIGKKNTLKLLGEYDKNINDIFKKINLDPHFPKHKPEGTKNIGFKIATFIIQILPSMIKSMFSDYKQVIKQYNKDTQKLFNTIDKVKTLNNINFKNIFIEAAKIFEENTNSMGMIFAGMLAHKEIKKIFKGENIETEITALSMDLDGNPTSEMGHLLFDMASHKDFQNTKTLEEFLTHLEKHTYSKEFMDMYYTFMKKFSCRGIMEIDIATKRVYEDLSLLYNQLKNIDITDNQILYVKQKRLEAYSTLLQKAKEKNKEKQFINAAERFQKTFGYREFPKYVIVYMFSALHQLCLNIAQEWVEQKRLKDPYQIFDLTIDNISKGQADSSFDLLSARNHNLEGYKKVEHIKNWPLVIDSRGKIYTPEIEIKNGDFIGQAIAPGKVQGKVKILHEPYEKPLLPGEILVTRATEPSWTPIFTNAAGVIMEIGGPLQHGGIIAREYGIPCVSGLIGIMSILKDGDNIEIDGSHGVVRIIDQ